MLQICLGNYAELVKSEEDISDFKSYLENQLGQNFQLWNRDRASQAGQRWINESYLKTIYPEAVRQIETKSEAEVVSLLKELIKDPYIGKKVLESRRH